MANELEFPFFVKIYSGEHPPDYIRLDKILCLYSTDGVYKIEYDTPAEICFFCITKECFESLIHLLDLENKILDTKPAYQNGGWK